MTGNQCFKTGSHGSTEMTGEFPAIKKNMALSANNKQTLSGPMLFGTNQNQIPL